MAHTNGHIPKFNEHQNSLSLRIARCERDFYQELSEQYANELRNIQESINKYGYWTYVNEDGDTVKLVKQDCSAGSNE